MTSAFDTALRQTGAHLGELLQMTNPAPAAGPDSALAGRASVLQLVLSIDRTMRLAIPAADDALQDGLDALAVVPIGVAAQTRTRLALLAPEGSHELLATEGRCPAERAWLSVHRQAVVARHYWEQTSYIDRPWGERQWTLTADATALTAALLRLDPAIAAQLTSEGRSDDAAILTGPRHIGAAIALNRAWEVATAGPLGVAPLLPEDDPTSLLAVNDVDDLPEALERLGAQLGTHHISPAAMRQVLAHLVRAAAAAADILGRDAGGKAVRSYAAAVSAAGRQIRALATIELHDDTAVYQAKAVSDFLVAEAANERRSRAARELTGRFPVLVDAIAKSTVEQIYCGRWLIADGSDHEALLWSQANLYGRRPLCVDALEDVGRVHSRTPTVAPLPAPTIAPPWQVLIEALPVDVAAPRPALPTSRYRRLGEDGTDTVEWAAAEQHVMERAFPAQTSFAVAFPARNATRSLPCLDIADSMSAAVLPPVISAPDLAL